MKLLQPSCYRNEIFFIVVGRKFFIISTCFSFIFRLTVHSRMWDACLVIDGGSSFAFNDAAEATLEIHEEDALRTVTLE